MKNPDYEYKKFQIEKYLKSEFQKKFRKQGRISIRKRQKFMQEITRKASRKFGKDILFLIDFEKGGFVSLFSPAKTESTDKGKLYQSFAHAQIYYTSHCIDRFSQRTDTMENCILKLDAYMGEALLTFGENEGFLPCPVGVFAYTLEDERLIVKTFINFDMLSEEQILQFYGPGTTSLIAQEFLTDDFDQSDFIMMDELSGENEYHVEDSKSNP
ncbi:MAG: hypothetical protein COV67_02150 [Nitrospinae bacterium CG11_big_fil_rev_8_21_14_0_20_56_8]|nr:MAG: hypothetical protein COV67_02150 [Nitrospinae bacterium CG11_big_fil_rev_8_21_14_0_20_56_8]